MSFTVQTFIDAVRSFHPAFSRYLVPDRALMDFATREQQRLMSLAVMRDRTYLTQTMSILFDLNNADLDAPGVAGDGTAGGLPVQSNGSGGYKYLEATAGSALSVTEGQVSVSETAVVSATSTSLTGLAVAWTTNAYAGLLAVIVAGTGANTAPRVIASNTATGLTVTAPWEVTPDATSLFRVVAPVPTLDTTVGAVTDLPATTLRRGYLVRLNAQGTAYIDYTAPLVGHLSKGIPLPGFYAVLGGTIRFSSALGAPFASQQADYGASPFHLVHEAARFSVNALSGYLRGTSLFLCGSRSDWFGVESIALHYVPIPTAFAARTDLFLLPDSALPALAAGGAVFAASRLVGLQDVPQAPSDLLVAKASEAEATYLSTVGLSKRARIGRVRPGGR